MSSGYLWIKAFHIVFVASWFAGLFYLPRILVNLAQVQTDSTAEHERLLGMGRRLYRFSMLLMVPALLLGLWLWLGVGVRGGGRDAKLVVVVAAIGYHHFCGALLGRFEQRTNRRSERWVRLCTEASVLRVTAVVVLVVVKPFCTATAARPGRWPRCGPRWWCTPAWTPSSAGAGRRG